LVKSDFNRPVFTTMPMSQLELLTSHTWPTAEMALGSLGLHIDELASRLGLPVHRWTVDGLGPARGFGCRLPSGRVFLLEELELSVRYHEAKGPNIHVDAADLAANGIESLLVEILDALGLARSDAIAVADREAEQTAARFVTSAREYRARQKRSET
jgi:hypothetical protein